LGGVFDQRTPDIEETAMGWFSKHEQAHDIDHAASILESTANKNRRDGFKETADIQSGQVKRMRTEARRMRES
jgi:hypothetical protein